MRRIAGARTVRSSISGVSLISPCSPRTTAVEDAWRVMWRRHHTHTPPVTTAAAARYALLVPISPGSLCWHAGCCYTLEKRFVQRFEWWGENVDDPTAWPRERELWRERAARAEPGTTTGRERLSAAIVALKWHTGTRLQH